MKDGTHIAHQVGIGECQSTIVCFLVGLNIRFSVLSSHGNFIVSRVQFYGYYIGVMVWHYSLAGEGCGVMIWSHPTVARLYIDPALFGHIAHNLPVIHRPQD